MSVPRLPALVLAAAIAAFAALPGAASAQCRLCDSPTTGPEETKPADQIRLEVETNLNFDRLILFGEGEGSAVIRPDGSSAAAGAVADIGSRAMVGTANVHGEPGRAVRIDLPHQIDLYSIGGGRIRFEDVVSDLPAVPRLDSAGNLSFRFGGTLKITGDADGAYRGDLPITVEYQ
jgi:hypothetical protein